MIIKKIDLGYEMISNCYLVADEESKEAAVVDPGAYDEGNGIDAELQSGVFTLKYILLTHGHFDHILGVHGLRKKYGAKVVIHDADAICLGNAHMSLAEDNGIAHLQKFVNPDILLEGGEVLYLGKNKIKVIYTPGHTQGGVCYVDESDKAVFTGDTLFCMTVGRTDFEGGSVEQLAESLKKLLTLEGDYRVLPGHNRETTLEREKTHNRFIRRM